MHEHWNHWPSVTCNGVLLKAWHYSWPITLGLEMPSLYNDGCVCAEIRWCSVDFMCFFKVWIIITELVQLRLININLFHIFLIFVCSRNDFKITRRFEMVTVLPSLRQTQRDFALWRETLHVASDFSQYPACFTSCLISFTRRSQVQEHGETVMLGCVNSQVGT